MSTGIFYVLHRDCDEYKDNLSISRETVMRIDIL